MSFSSNNFGNIYNATTPVRTENQSGPTQTDVNGSIRERETYCPVYEDNANGVAAVVIKPLPVGTYAPSVDMSAALEASTVTKASTGTFIGASGRIDSSAPTATYYIMILNYAALPADGAVNRICGSHKIIHVTGTDSIFNIFPPLGLYASVGITLCISTTEWLKAISGAYLTLDVFYI